MSLSTSLVASTGFIKTGCSIKPSLYVPPYAGRTKVMRVKKRNPKINEEVTKTKPEPKTICRSSLVSDKKILKMF